jgi:hypothetical protein
MDLISIILIIVFVSKILKKTEKKSNRGKAIETIQNVWDQIADEVQRQAYTPGTEGRASAPVFQMPKQNVRTTPAYEQLNMQSYMEGQDVKERMANTKQRILESRGMHSTGSKHMEQSAQYRNQENKKAMQQIREGRMEAKNTSILERAAKNTDANKQDVTLAALEAEHNHSERVSAAEHYHPEDVISDNMLGTIDDLMIKGYDGELCFERDFLGEAMDMISHFTVPSDVPEF